MAVEKGQLPSDLDVALAAVMYRAAIDGALKNWLFSKESFCLNKEVERLVDACLDVLRYATSLRKGSSEETFVSGIY